MDSSNPHATVLCAHASGASHCRPADEYCPWVDAPIGATVTPVVPCGHPVLVDNKWTACDTPAGECVKHPSSRMGWAVLASFPRKRYFVKATSDDWEVYGDADNTFS